MAEKATKGRRLKSAVFQVRSQPWTIILSPRNLKNRGECDYGQNAIRLCRGTADLRDTLIHEVLHAALPDLAEEAVVETAAAIDSALEAVEDWDIL